MLCLTEDEVIAIVSGAMAGEALAQAEAHVDVCRTCRLLLSSLAHRTGERGHFGHLSAFSSDDIIAKRYRVIRLIGAGGMGEVYETWDLELGDRVALKTIAVRAALDAAGVARLKAEVQVARRVTHRNVCRVFDVGYHNDAGAHLAGGEALAIPFFTMELLPGETLGQLLRRKGRCSPEEALQLIGQIGSGLEALHRSGVIHSDLKSDNIMLVPEASGTRAVITDFGLAKRVDERLRGAHQGVAIAGTIGYMAPEQFGGAKISRRTDVYALGIILYELLTGDLPFTAEALAASAREGAPPARPSLSSAELPNAWMAVIERCMAPSPSARFADAEAVLAALRLAVGVPPAPRWRGSMVAAAVVVALLASGAALTMVLVSRPAADRPAADLPASPARVQVDALAGAATPSPLDVAPPAEVTRPSPPRHRPKRAVRAPSDHTSTEPFTRPNSPGDDDMIDPRGWR